MKGSKKTMREIKDVSKEWQRKIYHSLEDYDLDMIIFQMLDGVWKFCEDDEELIATIKELWNDDIKDSIELFWYLNVNENKFITTIYSDDKPWAYLIWPDDAKRPSNSPSREEYKKMIRELQNQGYSLEESILFILENQKKSETN